MIPLVDSHAFLLTRGAPRRCPKDARFNFAFATNVCADPADTKSVTVKAKVFCKLAGPLTGTP